MTASDDFEKRAREVGCYAGIDCDDDNYKARIRELEAENKRVTELYGDAVCKVNLFCHAREKAEAELARVRWRLSHIRKNPHDNVAMRFAYNASDAEVDAEATLEEKP